MIKKFVILLAIGLLVVVAAAGCEPAEEEAEFADGSYEGTAEGYAGPLTVEVLIEGGEIADVVVVDHEETEEIMEDTGVLETIPEEIVANQGTEGVDAVTEATETSEAIFDAVEEALDQAR